MAVAFDATSAYGSLINTDDTYTWDHTPVGTPKGVLAFVFYSGVNSDLVTAFPYGGTSFTAVTGGVADDTAAEVMRCRAYFLGSSVPTGTQTVSITYSGIAGGQDTWVCVYTVTATNDTQVYTSGIVLEQENQAITEENVDDGSPGTNSVRFVGIGSGISTPGPSVGSNTTLGSWIAVGGARTLLSAYETTAGQGSRPVGFSGASDDVAAVYLAVTEQAAPGSNIVANLTAGFQIDALASQIRLQTTNLITTFSTLGSIDANQSSASIAADLVTSFSVSDGDSLIIYVAGLSTLEAGFVAEPNPNASTYTNIAGTLTATASLGNTRTNITALYTGELQAGFQGEFPLATFSLIADLVAGFTLDGETGLGADVTKMLRPGRDYVLQGKDYVRGLAKTLVKDYDD